MLQEADHRAPTRNTHPQRSSVSLLNHSPLSLRNESFHELGPASSSLAGTLMESVRVPRKRTCELPSVDVPSTSDAAPGFSSTVTHVISRKKPSRGEDVRGTEQHLLLSLQTLSPLFHLSLDEAAEKLGLCRTALKVDPTISQTRLSIPTIGDIPTIRNSRVSASAHATSP